MTDTLNKPASSALGWDARAVSNEDSPFFAMLSTLTQTAHSDLVTHKNADPLSLECIPDVARPVVVSARPETKKATLVMPKRMLAWVNVLSLW
jgi:hypothetical protein